MKSIAFRIFKRPFNPSSEEAKNVRVLVGQFTKSGEKEAKLLHQTLVDMSTSLKGDNEFSHFRYTLVEEAEPVRNRYDGLDLDYSKAKPTPRPITFNLTWDVKHNVCSIIAISKMHGCIRADIEDEVMARQAFVRKIAVVWPNATLTRK